MGTINRRPLWLFIGWSMVLTVVILSLMPHPPEPLEFNHADKLEHYAAYASLSCWFLTLLYPKHSVRVMLALVALGVSLEFIQGWIGYRMFDFYDMLANSLGVLFGFFVALVLRNYFNRM